jgi:transcriptional regulator with XRE-family HTH domain
MHFYMQNCLTPGGAGGTLLPVSRTLVGELRADLGVSRRLFARLTGYSERAIASWEAGRELSEPSRQRMIETRRLEKALARVIKPAAVGRWLEEPNRAFRGLKPLEVVERGEVDRIWRMIFDLESGTPG